MPKLDPQDQQHVDRYLHSNVNAVERREFKPLRLLGIIFVVLLMLTGLSYFVALKNGLV